jgi:hypothetical protein
MGQSPEYAHTGKGLWGVDYEAYQLISYRNKITAVEFSVVRFGKGVIGFKSRTIDLAAASDREHCPKLARSTNSLSPPYRKLSHAILEIYHYPECIAIENL